MINLKGGVGKTTITVALAEFLTLEYHKKVLVIDLDPQTNATVSLMKDKEWRKKDEQGETLLQLFKDKIDDTDKFDLDKTIVKGVSNIDGGINNLHLLPSSLGFIEIQDSLSTTHGKFHLQSPVKILKKSISDKLKHYDIVLIDCPPSLGIVTLNGLLISDYYLIPCTPTVLSTYGIPQIISHIKLFSDESEHKVDPLGIVITMYRSGIINYDIEVKRIRNKSSTKDYPRTFDAVIPMAVKASDATNIESTSSKLQKKYSSSKLYEQYDALTKEFLRYLEL